VLFTGGISGLQDSNFDILVGEVAKLLGEVQRGVVGGSPPIASVSTDIPPPY